MVTLGYEHTRGAEDYLVAGKKIHPVILSLSYGATFISTSVIMGLGGVAGQLGMGVLWLTVFNIAVGILIAFTVVGKKTLEFGNRLKAVTFLDLIWKCYNSSFMQYVSGLVIVVAMPLYIAAILIGGARFIEATIQINFNMAFLGFAMIVAVYVMVGGLIAVMYTDTLQGANILFGMTALLVFICIPPGGAVEAHPALTATISLVPESEALAAGGHTAGSGCRSLDPLYGSPW